MTYGDKMKESIFSCKNKIAVVTGGSGLIGKEIVKSLADAGAKVIIADFVAPKNMVKNSKIKFIQMDITSEKSITNAFKVIKKIDILINCAYPRTKDWGNKFEKVSYNSWKENVNNHLGGYFLTCKAVAEKMKKQGNNSIINIASIYGIVAPDFSVYEGTEMTMPVAYSAIKSGIIGLTKYLSTYYAKYGIRANCVSPGGIYNGQSTSFVNKYSKKTPLGRMGKPLDIVGAVIYLASDASSYVTGQNIVVDGGWTAW